MFLVHQTIGSHPGDHLTVGLGSDPFRTLMTGGRPRGRPDLVALTTTAAPHGCFAHDYLHARTQGCPGREGHFLTGADDTTKLNI